MRKPLLWLIVLLTALMPLLACAEGEAPAFYVLRDGVRFDVTIQSLGTVYTTVVCENEVLTIPTGQLKWDDDISTDERALASVTADVRGYTPLLTKASRHAPALGSCVYGQLLLVLDYSATYCRVWTKGQVGYVRTNNLDFYPRTPDPTDKAPKAGVLVAKKNDTVTLRARRDTHSLTVARLPVGTKVWVLNHKNDFYLIEADGYRGYVPEKKVELAED